MDNNEKVDINQVKDLIEALEKERIKNGEPVDAIEIVEEVAKIMLPLNKAWSVVVFNLKCKLESKLRINWWKFKQFFKFNGGTDE